MIFISLILEVAMLFFFAACSGDAGTFYNLDSILIVLFAFIVSSLAMSMGRFKIYFKGLSQIFTFKKVEKSKDVKNMFTAISIMTMVVSIASTAQGLISSTLIAAKGILDVPSYTGGQILSFASFTTIYALVFVVLVLVPIIYLNKD